MVDRHAIPGATIEAAAFPSKPYPGRTPSGSYVLVGDRVVALNSEDPRRLRSGQPLGSMIRALTDQPFGVVMAYGSNGCPSRLVEKFGVDEAPTIVLRAELEGARAAWCRSRSKRTSHRAWTLVRAPGARSACHVLLVAASNSGTLDSSEGREASLYALARLPGLTASIAGLGDWSSPVTYLGVGGRGPLMRNGRPVIVAEAPDEPSDPDVPSASDWDDRDLVRHEVIPLSVGLLDLRRPPVLADLP